MSTPDVAVIVPCRNEAKALPTFLDSLTSQDLHGLKVEIIVADGCSTDSTREVLNRFAARVPFVQIIENPQQIVSTGLNMAIRLARAPVIMRMDVHTSYAPDYIWQCVKCLEAIGAGNVGGAARTKLNEKPICRAFAAAYRSRFACGGALFHDADYEGEVDTVPYGCWRKQTLEEVGLFDETLVRNQDDELNLRLRNAGMTIWQSAAIVSWYQPRTSLVPLFRQYLQYGFWKVAVIRKHGRPASWRHLIPGTFVLTCILLAVAAGVGWAIGLPVVVSTSLTLSATLAVLYLAACVIASASCLHDAGWAAVMLPAIFATYHLSYGIGFLLGTLYWPVAARRPIPPKSFATLTR